jgi:hypothetical protein
MNYVKDIIQFNEDRKNRRDLINILNKAYDFCGRSIYGFTTSTKKRTEAEAEVKNIINIISNDDKYLRLSNNVSVVYDQNGKKISIKFGRYIRKFFHKQWCKVNSAYMDDFISHVNSFIAYKAFKNNYKIYNGKDIIDVYKDSKGSLVSCMSGRRSIFAKFYAINPDKVSICVFMDNDNTPINRFLIWTDDNDNKIVDKSYGKYHCLSKFFADEKGYYHVDNISNKRIKITMNVCEEKYFPYVDCFYYAKPICKGKKVILSNMLYKCTNQITLYNTDGFCCDYNNVFAIKCPICKKSKIESYSFKYKKIVCGNCYYD